MKSLLVAALLGGAFLAMDAQAAGDPEAGKGKIAACAACHGTDGMGTAPIYPNLAGQSAAYLESAMKAYRDGQRGGGMSAIMAPQAQGLSDEDIADIAAYYASLQP
ncbi:c-type cytochrome [Halomonas ventosae]|uniref:Cytochrome c553 n=1 Tax=Halomonas ventosae TaxID=229007 RepID=A0A2T0VRR0_9GAMM|nr:cytochrome c [Halomonas ventosae]PRY73110.1 cytochrome c553 [Halomonas ventosae]